MLVGDGAERGRLEVEVRRRGLDNVIFTGLVNKDEVRDILRSADACLVHLRRAELFATVLPSKMFEAFAMQRPVILGLEGEARKVMDEADAGIAIPPEDPAALAKAIGLLADDSDLCRRFGENGRRFVREKYNRDHLASEYRGLLGEYDPSPKAVCEEARKIRLAKTAVLPPRALR